jgi:hypothetical protein
LALGAALVYGERDYALDNRGTPPTVNVVKRLIELAKLSGRTGLQKVIDITTIDRSAL